MDYEEQLALAPCDLVYTRPTRYDGSGFSVQLSHFAPALDLPDHLSVGQPPIQNPLELIPLDLPLQPECARTLAAPDPCFRVLIG